MDFGAPILQFGIRPGEKDPAVFLAVRRGTAIDIAMKGGGWGKGDQGGGGEEEERRSGGGGGGSRAEQRWEG